MTVEQRIEGEKRVLTMLCNLILAKGYILCVNDGGERIKCKTVEEAIDNIFGVEESWISFYDRETKAYLGDFYIILGNSPAEVIADCTISVETDELNRQINLFIDENFPD